MAKTLQRIGEIKCTCCDERTPVKEQGNGFSMYSCDWCGVTVQAHAKESDSRIRAKMISKEKPEDKKPEVETELEKVLPAKEIPAGKAVAKVSSKWEL